ncbi:hypothetical protein [Amycolatopsis jejuensis]|uniref:hypothetical protein n=1 Tax=Amycolatopsis jejuensis TaxID=330084 RepID=UPI0005278654|nr:hypothetical protein [Amycolatopsis jejuensis]
MEGADPEQVALHVLRAWRTPDGLLRVRITTTTDVRTAAVTSVVLTTHDQVLASVARWLRRIGPADGDVTPR